MIMVIYLLMTFYKPKISIFIAGDCIGKLQLAHVSSKEAILVEHMFNGNGLPLNYDKMPKCIYTPRSCFNWL